jgi:uncharacterized protein (TIGR03083 family)
MGPSDAGTSAQGPIMVAAGRRPPACTTVSARTGRVHEGVAAPRTGPGKTGSMERDLALGVVAEEAERILSLTRGAGSSAGKLRPPACPAWTLSDLVSHLGRVYAMVVTAIGTGPTGTLERSAVPRRPEDQDPADWLEERLAIMLDGLRSLPDSARCWNFVDGPGGPVGFWWRRQAHETLIHRVDAEQACGLPVTPVSPEVAADGISELLGLAGLREVRFDQLELGDEMSLHLHATDAASAEWTIDTGRHTYATAHVKADVAVRGPAFALDLWCWRRASARPPGSSPGPLPSLGSEIAAFGDVAAAEEWLPAL